MDSKKNPTITTSPTPKVLAWRITKNHQAEPLYSLVRVPCDPEDAPKSGELIKIRLPKKLSGPISTHTTVTTQSVTSNSPTSATKPIPSPPLGSMFHIPSTTHSPTTSSTLPGASAGVSPAPEGTGASAGISPAPEGIGASAGVSPAPKASTTAASEKNTSTGLDTATIAEYVGGMPSKQSMKQKKVYIKKRSQNKNHTALVLASTTVGTMTNLVVLPVPSYSNAIDSSYESAKHWVSLQSHLIHVPIPYFNEALGHVIHPEPMQGFNETLSFNPPVYESKPGFILYDPMTIEIPKGMVRYSTFPGRPRIPANQIDALIPYCEARQKVNKPAAAGSIFETNDDDSEEDNGYHEEDDVDVGEHEEEFDVASNSSIQTDDIPFSELLRSLGIEDAETRAARFMKTQRVSDWVATQGVSAAGA